MFEDVFGVGVVAQVRAIALDRTIRQAQAEQAVQVATMYRERDEMLGLGDPDAGLTVAGRQA